MKAFAYVNPSNEQEAVAALSAERGRFLPIAGGMDLLGTMKDFIVSPERLVNIKALDRTIAAESGGMRIGAAVAQMEERVGNQTTLPPGSEGDGIKPGAQGLTASPHVILVDQSGVRYMNEGGSYMAYAKKMLERNKTVPAVPSWAIFDSQYTSKYMMGSVVPSAKKLQQWFDAGYLKRADTIEGLAAQIGVEPQALAATVTRFNGFVAKNHDDDFGRGDIPYDRWLGDPVHKPSETLGSIEQGPFYAVPVLPGDVGTYGGVVTDECARVLRADGSVIAGLYATGVSTASVMGRSYPGAGSSVGPSFTWGYVAARHAAGVAN